MTASVVLQSGDVLEFHQEWIPLDDGPCAKLLPGSKWYTLNGEPITLDEANYLILSLQSQQDVTNVTPLTS